MCFLYDTTDNRTQTQTQNHTTSISNSNKNIYIKNQLKYVLCPFVCI